MPIVINGSGTVTGLSAGGISNTKAVASAAMPSGSVIQVVEHALKTAHVTSTGDQWHDSTLGGAITTQFDDSKVLVDMRMEINNSRYEFIMSGLLYRGGSVITAANSTANGSRPATWWTVGVHSNDNYDRGNVAALYLDTPGNAGSYTYNVYVRDYRDNQDLFINRGSYDADSDNAPVGKSTLTLTEIRG